MKNKKGVSDLIAWILLVGFTITTAAFVTTWVIDQTKNIPIEDMAGGANLYCEDVVLGIESISPLVINAETCEGGNYYNTLPLILKNKGKFTIIKIKGLGAGMGASSIKHFPDAGLKPGESTPTLTPVEIYFCKYDSNNEIEIIPIIKMNGKETYCGKNTMVINDIILDSAPHAAS